MYRTDTNCRIDGANALHRCSKCLPKYALVLMAIVLWLPFAALAKDLELLTRYLIPPFLAQNFTAACRNNDASFLAVASRLFRTFFQATAPALLFCS